MFAQAYDAFNADPTQVYTIARFEFDHSLPDPCACLETPVCIGLEFATYLDGAMAETNFALENGFLTWNDPTNSMHCPAGVFAVGTGECAPTPVHAGSWGSVKASYR